MLTNDEKALAANPDILLAKNRIIQAVYDLLGQLAEQYKSLTIGLPPEIVRPHPKISRGENYLGLPWVMLDYPRFFVGKETFAIRTMFWWGHYFSLHLLLQGSKMQLLSETEIGNDWFLSKAIDPWQHQFHAAQSIPSQALSRAVLAEQAEKGFIKLSCYLPLSEWDGAEEFLKVKFGEAVSMVKNQTAD